MPTIKVRPALSCGERSDNKIGRGALIEVYIIYMFLFPCFSESHRFSMEIDRRATCEDLGSRK